MESGSLAVDAGGEAEVADQAAQGDDRGAKAVVVVDGVAVGVVHGAAHGVEGGKVVVEAFARGLELVAAAQGGFHEWRERALLEGFPEVLAPIGLDAADTGFAALGVRSCIGAFRRRGCRPLFQPMKTQTASRTGAPVGMSIEGVRQVTGQAGTSHEGEVEAAAGVDHLERPIPVPGQVLVVEDRDGAGRISNTFTISRKNS